VEGRREQRGQLVRRREVVLIWLRIRPSSISRGKIRRPIGRGNMKYARRKHRSLNENPRREFDLIARQAGKGTNPISRTGEEKCMEPSVLVAMRRRNAPDDVHDNSQCWENAKKKPPPREVMERGACRSGDYDLPETLQAKRRENSRRADAGKRRHES